MSGKRVADRYLTDRNFQEDEDIEEDPQERTADASVLANRVIKKAKKRTNMYDSGEIENKKSLFANFSAFSNGFAPTIPVQPVSTAPSFSFSPLSASTSQKQIHEKKLRDIKGLNVSFLEYLRTSVEQNPLVDLRSLLQQYVLFRSEIESEDQISNSSSTKTSENSTYDRNDGSSSTSPPVMITHKYPPFIANTPLPTHVNSVGANVPSDSSKGLFQLAPFQFNPTEAQPQVSLGVIGGTPEVVHNEDSDGDDGPVVAEQLQSPEKVLRGAGEENETSLYEVRCKVFLWRNESWVDVGVGFLKFSQQTDDHKKRILVRAEGTGKVLMNIRVSPGLNFTHESGKKSVNFVSFNPDKTVTKHLVMISSAEEASSFVKCLRENEDK